MGDDRRTGRRPARGLVHGDAARGWRRLAGRKVTEEATEVLLAAKNDEAAEAAGSDRAATQALLAGEAADLLYHALVLLAERGLAPGAVIDVLRGRHGRPARG